MQSTSWSQILNRLVMATEHDMPCVPCHRDEASLLTPSSPLVCGQQGTDTNEQSLYQRRITEECKRT